MREKKLNQQDFPIAETRPSEVKGKRGMALSELTIEAILEGTVGLDDLQITSEALLQQAEIAKSVGRKTLSENFERAAEMNNLPNSEVMEIYELLRPGPLLVRRARARRRVRVPAAAHRSRAREQP